MTTSPTNPDFKSLVKFNATHKGSDITIAGDDPLSRALKQYSSFLPQSESDITMRFFTDAPPAKSITPP